MQHGHINRLNSLSEHGAASESPSPGEFAQRSRTLTGKVIQERSRWNTVATSDSIRHFAYGISDDNPLWLDSEYAVSGPYKRRIAPPTYLASVLYPALHGAPIKQSFSPLISTLEYDWYEPILEGDSFQATARQTGVYESQDRQGHPLINILSDTYYWNQREILVGKAKTTLTWVARPCDGLLIDRSIYHYSETELNQIAQGICQASRTGKRVLTADELKVGRELPSLVRGPLSIGDLICWQAAIGPSYRSAALGYLDALAAPHTVTTHPVTGWPIKTSQQHEDFLLAAQRGMPAPFDNSVMRFAQISSLITNWIGDSGELKKLAIQVVAPILYGDTNWYSGQVTQSTSYNHGTVVDIGITGTNQLGDITTQGQATAWIPGHTDTPEILSPSSKQQHYNLAPISATEQLQCIHELVALQAEKHPDKTAIVCEGKALTFQELNQRANQLAHYLQSLGVGPEEVVGLYLSRSVEVAIAILAVLKAGCAYVPLDTNYPTKRVNFILRETLAQVLITEATLGSQELEFGGKSVCLDTDKENLSRQPTTWLESAVSPKNLAYIMYTSGSTGQPKGVQIAHANVSHYISAIGSLLAINSSDRYLHLASFSFTASVRQLFVPLICGATCVIATREQAQDPIRLFRLIKVHQVSVSDGIHSIWQYGLETIESLPNHDLKALVGPKLAKIVFSGDRLPTKLVLKLQSIFKRQIQIFNIHGQTETLGNCVYVVPDAYTSTNRFVPVGNPLPHNQAYILDETLAPVRPDEIGELCMSGGCLSRGYLNRPQLNIKRFMPCSFSNTASKQLFRTGDLARFLGDGSIEILERVDFQVKIRGMRVELGEVEAQLIAQPNIQQAIVKAQNDFRGESQLIGYVVFKDMMQDTQNCFRELQRSLLDSLPDYMVPTAWMPLQAVPLNKNGKIDYKALPSVQLAERQHSTGQTTQQSDSLFEQTIADVWCAVLGLDQVRYLDNFFELGGHSLLASQITNRLQALFHVDISSRDLFEAPTVSSMAALILNRQLMDMTPEEMANLLTEVEQLSV